MTLPEVLIAAAVSVLMTAAFFSLVAGARVFAARSARGLLDDDQAAILDAVAKFDAVLGVFGSEETEMLDAEIEELIIERQEARRNRDFARSDEIRDLLASKGIILEDTKDGLRWKRK